MNKKLLDGFRHHPADMQHLINYQILKEQAHKRPLNTSQGGPKVAKLSEELAQFGNDRIVKVDDIELASILGYLSGEKSFLIGLLQNINDQQKTIELIAHRLTQSGKFWEFVTELKGKYEIIDDEGYLSE